MPLTVADERIYLSTAPLSLKIQCEMPQTRGDSLRSIILGQKTEEEISVLGVRDASLSTCYFQ